MTWSELARDPSFWVAVAFVLFVVVFGRVLFRKLAGVLDAHRSGIRDELEAAAALHGEAQSLRDRYTDEAARAEKMADELRIRARESARHIGAEADQRLQTHLVRMRERAAEEIARSEEAARQAYREYVTDLVQEASIRLLRDRIDADTHQALIRSTVDRLGPSLGRIRNQPVPGS